MASNRSKRPRLGLGLGLGLPIGSFGTCVTLGLNLYTLSHEVVRRLHLRPFRPLWVLRDVLREGSAGHVRTRAAQIVHVMCSQWKNLSLFVWNRTSVPKEMKIRFHNA